ncbi:LPS O-antigen chain length determinant protein WzzB [Erwinia pyri]|uniref:Chain length determinant protein n=1 Tax=Erwinia pyri TaxID=3062598 RepID=A0AA50HMH7_9GAMM|nr:LPS O-antigen chain length determinant protein WzzB [Erwinia sp. DE2]WLS80313.1 LPS O-antigen chain length determinant protein WzzB [Erwinia sp. DE2]
MSNENQSVNSKYSPENKKANSREDDLDLFDIINQLWIGKKTILLTMLVMMVLAVVYLFFAKEKWTSEAIISQPSAGQVATYNNALSILYTQNIQDKLALPDLQKQIFGRYTASAYALSGTLKNLDEPLELKVSQVTQGKDDPLSITFTASTAKDAQQQLLHYITQLNTEVSNDFAVDMRNNIFVKMNGLKDSLAAQEKIAQDKKNHRIDVIKQAIKIAESAKISSTQLSQAEYLSDDTLYLLGTSALTSMIVNENTKPLELNDYYYDTQRTLLALTKLRIDFSKSQNFQFIKKPDLPIYRDSPKKGLTLVLALILGGVLGSCIVIARNMSKNYRERKIIN